MMQWLYSATGIAITPLLKAWLHRRAKRGKEDPKRMDERFGHASRPRPEGTVIWLHAASVGEAQSVLTLARALLEKYPAAHLLVTTGTVTSAALMAQQAIARVIHQYVPVDTATAVSRFLNHWQPDLALWVESEFWPQLLLRTRARRIPLLLINARLSSRSFANWQRWPRAITRLLGCFDTIYAGASEDAERLRTLTTTPVIEAGNLKFDAAALPVDAALLQELRDACGTRRHWLAASTHGNEEHMIAHAHRALRQRLPELLTMLVPRHAARGDALAQELRAMDLQVAQRSKGEAVLATTDIYLADTMGELGTFYRFAEITFLGGSLIAHGGHNPLEPARLDCAVITGPHTHNFATIMQHLHEAGALAVAQDTAALTRTVEQFLLQPQTARAMAATASEMVRRSHGASREIIARAAQLLERSA